MYMMVFYVVFGLVLRRGNSPEFVPFLLTGLVAWQWMKGCLTHGMQALLTYRSLMQRVYLPKIIFPIILIFVDTFKFLLVFTLLLVFLWFSNYPPNIYYLALPIILLVELLFIMAITFLMAAIIPFLPDIRFVTENILHAVFFLTGIFFQAHAVPEEYRFYFYLNPMANLIEDYRNILLYNAPPDWSALFVIALISMLGIAFSLRLIQRFDYIYPKITL